MEELDYVAFDRQVHTLAYACGILVDEWDDITTMEMNLDLKSLCMKSSRLCVMADLDYALQLQDITHHRAKQNEVMAGVMNGVVHECMSPHMIRVTDSVSAGSTLTGRKSEFLPKGIMKLMPKLGSLMDAEENDDNKAWSVLLDHVEALEKQYRKRVKPTVFSGMDFLERLWMLLELYAMLSYLLYHFKRVCRLCKDGKGDVDYAVLLREMISNYASSVKGAEDLELFWQTLKYDNDGSPTLAQLCEARKALRKDVPERLQACFMAHCNDLDALAHDLAERGTTDEEMDGLLSVLAKRQRLTEEIQLLEHPEQATPELYNEVFHLVLSDKRVDLKDLRQRIGRMLKLVTRKNHWFCVWSVLKYEGYLKETSYGAFARQMAHADWFGKDRSILPFSADTLNEYTGFFTDRIFTQWNETDYQLYRHSRSKTKWGEKLCQRFTYLCYDMQEQFRSASG